MTAFTTADVGIRLRSIAQKQSDLSGRLTVMNIDGYLSGSAARAKLSRLPEVLATAPRRSERPCARLCYPDRIDG